MLDEIECENAAELQAPFFWLPPERDKRPDGYPQEELQEKNWSNQSRQTSSLSQS